MARPKPKTFDKQKVVADNRRARFDYHIEDTFEAGLALHGTEVKALRAGQATIAESYAEARDGHFRFHIRALAAAAELARIGSFSEGTCLLARHIGPL